jgi:hypothetical protein
MFTQRPRLRYDGLYVHRSVVPKAGVMEGRGMKELGKDFYKPMLFVTTYRYLRFYPDGVVAHLLSSSKPVLEFRQVRRKSRRRVALGTFLFDEGGGVVVVKAPISSALHPNMIPSNVTLTLRVRRRRGGEVLAMGFESLCVEHEDGGVMQGVPKYSLQFVPLVGFVDRIAAVDWFR